MSKIYNPAELKSIDSEIHASSLSGDSALWQQTYNKYSHIPVTVEMPLGELTNPNIKGFIWASNIKKTLSYPFHIEERDHFNAQGLEGKFRIHTDMMVAIIILREVPPHRIQIKKDHVIGKYD